MTPVTAGVLESSQVPAGPDTSPLTDVHLSREMSVFSVTMIGVGAMIGAGIFVLTGIAAGVAGPALILVFRQYERHLISECSHVADPRSVAGDVPDNQSEGPPDRRIRSSGNELPAGFDPKLFNDGAVYYQKRHQGAGGADIG